MSKFYIGKNIHDFMNKNKNKSNDNNNNIESNETSENIKESEISIDDNTTAEEADKNEKGIARILTIARNKYIERGLVGTVDISFSVGIFTTSLSCEVSATDEIDNNNSPYNEDEKYTRMENLVIKSIDRVLLSLERRALYYKTNLLADKITLSNGVYISNMFFSVFTISLSLSATVISLFNSIAQREYQKALNS
mmetsp:Transcript_9365/g.8371  ORF Transcript_9365/g.8371 Transcript_9365/m.8371 type:complete len:195 (-) Transcript_9365:128-712(-)